MCTIPDWAYPKRNESINAYIWRLMDQGVDYMTAENLYRRIHRSIRQQAPQKKVLFPYRFVTSGMSSH